MRRIRLIVSGMVFSFVAVVLAQPDITPQKALARVLEQTPAQAAWFAPNFLAQIPLTQIDPIVKQYTGTLGAFKSAEVTADGFTLVMERGTAPAKIHLDSEGRIDSLWFGLPQLAHPASLEDTLKEFAALPGKVSVVVLEDGKTLAALHAEEPLAVGSAFKLAVLAGAQEDVGSGKHRMDEVFALRREWKSLPTGVLLDWPDDTPVTLATLENEMISISDNTGADAVLSIAGREQAEKYGPRNRPFLSTREAFVLKAKANAELLNRYRAADEKGRRALLLEIDKLPLPSVQEFGEGPVATDVEWFFTVGELCALAEKTADAGAFRINAGLANAADWKQIAFKGGSEGGVLNLTTALAGKNGKHYCAAATWNDKTAVAQSKFFASYGNLINTLAKSSVK